MFLLSYIVIFLLEASDIIKRNKRSTENTKANEWTEKLET